VNALYRASTRWILTGALLIATVEAVYYPELLGLFGAAYQRAGVVVLLFVVGQLANAAAGPVGMLLMMTDHQYVNAVDNWVLAVLNVGLSYWFILEFGLVGAALGTVSSFLVMNSIQVGQLWYYEGFFPLSRRTLKPVGASLGMAGTMYAVDALLAVPRTTLVAVGSLAGTVAFFALLRAFGIEPEDRELVDALSEQYRSRVRERQ
jgi:O-antigen/teichoic acid export membrane protein